LINLLGNAVKFTDAGSVLLRMQAEPSGTDGLGLTILVEDTGPGIDAGEIDRLFNAFEQTTLGRRNGMGTGLGLAISRQLAQLMGGDVTVDSTPGEGSRFRLKFLAREGMAAASIKHERRRVLRIEDHQPVCRVLVVDDMEDSRELLSQTLEDAGFDVANASDGIQAVKAFANLVPRLILMDSHMPGMDGNEAIRRIRNSPGGSLVRIIMITASATDDVRERALANGADDFIAKPFRQSELFEKIRLLTGVRYLYDESEPVESPGSAKPVNLTKEMTAILPAALRASIHENAIRARQDQLLELLKEVTIIDPQLGKGLRDLVLKFDYETIVQINS
jgi:CheY-like chemotaxis protein/anti-sigma regulatory factor (Ser/Thr protein kinase)